MLCSILLLAIQYILLLYICLFFILISLHELEYLLKHVLLPFKCI